MPISKKLRFEVFKRDNFTCQYCGRQTPNVILELDHIVPVCEGGDDDIQNLITSCFECNRGKAGTPLTFVKTRADLQEDLLNLAEKELQLREYRKVQRKITQRENKDIARIDHAYQEWWGSDQELSQYGKESFRAFLKIFSADKIIEAVNQAAMKTDPHNPQRMIKYTYGILHHWRRGE